MTRSLPSSSQAKNHFLFLLPPSTTPAEQDVIANAARELAPMGYVYIASAHEKTMEDRGDIRFMPLRDGTLPCFGAVTGVMIVRDRELVRQAQENYPGAPIVVFDPAEAAQKEMGFDELQVPMLAAAAAVRPRLKAARAKVAQAA